MFKIVIGIILILALIVIGPLATIWALLNIRDMITGSDPWTWQNWLSIVILGTFFRAQVSVKR